MLIYNWHLKWYVIAFSPSWCGVCIILSTLFVFAAKQTNCYQKLLVVLVSEAELIHSLSFSFFLFITT